MGDVHAERAPEALTDPRARGVPLRWCYSTSYYVRTVLKSRLACKGSLITAGARAIHAENRAPPPALA